jgi:hypothetical protein
VTYKTRTTTGKGRTGRRAEFGCAFGWVIALLGTLGAAPALAERCDGPPSQADIDDPATRKWHFCITVTRGSDGEWTLDGDRKTKDIEVPPGDTARLIFVIDRDYRGEAWLAAVSIAKKDGSKAPMREFVGEQEPRVDFGEREKVDLPGRRQIYPIIDANQIRADYDYEVWVGTADGEQRVDPGIRNGGRQN